jgi:hypothetical protein
MENRNQKINWSEFKFRCHRLKDLMTEPKAGITPLQLAKIEEYKSKKNLTLKQSQELQRLIEKRDNAETLSETAKNYLNEVYVAQVYGREKDVTSKFIEKGLYVEKDSFDLLYDFSKILVYKNKETRTNEHITGTPDIVLEDKIIDIKSSWDLFSFIKSKKSYREYYWQMQGYMWLFDKHVADLAFCLTDAPEHLIVREKTKAMYETAFEPGTPEYDDLENQIETNMVFSHGPKAIPVNKRVKIYTIERHESSIQKLRERITAAREYLENLDL